MKQLFVHGTFLDADVRNQLGIKTVGEPVPAILWNYTRNFIPNVDDTLYSPCAVKKPNKPIGGEIITLEDISDLEKMDAIEGNNFRRQEVFVYPEQKIEDVYNSKLESSSVERKGLVGKLKSFYNWYRNLDSSDYDRVTPILVETYVLASPQKAKKTQVSLPETKKYVSELAQQQNPELYR